MSYTSYQGEILVNPPLKKSDARIAITISNQETSEAAHPFLDAISRGKTKEDLPYYGGLLEFSDDGICILPEERESRPGVAAWLDLLIEHFFIPRGYTLNGEITWEDSEDAGDRGVIYVDNNRVEMVWDAILNAGPSWDRHSYMSEKVKELIQTLLESADEEGCSPDRTVVSAGAVKALQAVVAPDNSGGAQAPPQRYWPHEPLLMEHAISHPLKIGAPNSIE